MLCIRIVPVPEGKDVTSARKNEDLLNKQNIQTQKLRHNEINIFKKRYNCYTYNIDFKILYIMHSFTNEKQSISLKTVTIFFFFIITTSNHLQHHTNTFLWLLGYYI